MARRGRLHVRRGAGPRPAGSGGQGSVRSAPLGEVALIVPTVDIRETGETHTIDGVEIEFQMAPGSNT